MSYRARVNDMWLNVGKLWAEEVYAAKYANPIAAHTALRRFVGKRHIKDARYFIINADDSVFAEFQPDAIPKGICIKLMVECDGTYSASAGGFKSRCRSPYTAARKVIGHWMEKQHG